VIGAVLTGGYGKRMQSVAENIPKTMLKLKENYTILDRQLMDFSSAGVKDVYLLIGFRKEVIKERYGNSFYGINIHYFEEEKPMGTLWAIRNLFDNVDDDVILRNGDTICDMDMNDLIDFSKKHDKIFSMVLVKMISPFGIVKVRGNNVLEFQEKPILNHYINAGYYLIRKDIRKYLEREYQDKDIEKSVFPVLAKDGQIAGLKYQGFWKSVDSAKDYEEVVKSYSNRDDFNFGSLIRGETSSFLRILRNKEVPVSGKGWVVIREGRIRIDGKLRKNNTVIELNGEKIIKAERMSLIEIGEGFENR
jgi:NDP-sugar pyrophosphorylase family protein